MYLLLVFLPLISSIISGLFGRFLGAKGSGIFTSVCILIACIISWWSLYEIGILGTVVYYPLFTWLNTGLLNLKFGLIFDSITVVMLTLVTTVSGLVHVYSTGYMSHDPHLPRFMAYLSLFTFFMVTLVTSDNLLQLFIGWEGVGVCSYLLINFWFTRIQANKAAIKAMVVNRIGDIGLALAMFIIYDVFKSLKFSVIFSTVDVLKDTCITIFTFSFNALVVISILLLIGATGKSAQLGLHTWLPDAMEGPTPVSALIHAATMVTAGVFLLIRCSPLLEFAPTALTIITIIGALTAFFAATVGVTQNDIKKVIAYSTCSQLGYMVFACGISNYAVSLFHLMNHGFFKALLFLSAGAVIHAMSDEQDMRKLGALIGPLPFTYTMMLIGSLSLMGFPFLTGFYSKDAILEFAQASFTFNGYFAYWLGTISAFFTAFYSLRLLYYTFLTNTNSNIKVFKLAHESPWNMSLPLLILAFGSIFIGYCFKDMFIGMGTPFFSNAIFVMFDHYKVAEAEFLDPILKWIPVILSFIAATIAIILYSTYSHITYNFTTSKWGAIIYTFLNNKWHFDYIYNSLIVKPVLNFSNTTTYKIIDRGLVELIGPQGIIITLGKVTTNLSNIQSGIIYNYAFVIFIGTTSILTILSVINVVPFDIIIILPIFIYLLKNK